jgi:hypothetical protein
MRSQLTDANISNINGGNWVANYSYYKNGDMISRMIQANQTGFTYSGNRMITAGGSGLDYDENGNMLNNASAKTLEYNWDNKLRRFKDGDYVKLASNMTRQATEYIKKQATARQNASISLILSATCRPY